MNKQDMVYRVANENNMTKAAAERAIESVLDCIKSGLQADGAVKLVGFGSFSVKHLPERLGHNPQNRKQITIPARAKVKFSPSSVLQSAVNE